MSERVQLSNGTSWPKPDADLAWRLRYSKVSREDLLAASSILHAYEFLLTATTRESRDFVVREMRAHFLAASSSPASSGTSAEGADHG